MTIEKGAPWGAEYVITGREVIAHTDAEALDAIAPALGAGTSPPPVVLRGGDLFTMLGARPAEPSRCFPVDVIDVVADDRHHRALGHVIARRWGWRGRFVIAMNGAYVGEWNLGPRAHPDDGLLDITDGALPLRALLQARRRARTGQHLPHPDLATRRAAAAEFAFDHEAHLYVDGRSCGHCRTLVLTVRPDAATVVI